MRVLVRADASVRIGSGHVMRCLTLADALRSAGAEVRFVCRLLTGHMADAIAARGFDVVRLPAGSGPVDAGPPHVGWLEESPDVDAAQCRSALADEIPFDWLIVDHYALDAVWEGAMRSVARRVMVIDDVADRDHDCDLLLDQNLAPDPRARYVQRVPAEATCLFGPRFALLRRQFHDAHAARDTEAVAEVQAISVFLGGGDPNGVTARVLDVLATALPPSVHTTAIVGSSNPHSERIRARFSGHPTFRVVDHCEDMAGHLTACQMAIGAGGVAALERSCLGVPSVVIATAGNQEAPARNLALAGACLYLGKAEAVSDYSIEAAVRVLLENAVLRQSMIRAGTALVDGLGCDRVARQLLCGRVDVRLALADDLAIVFEWRNAWQTRQYFHDTRPLDLSAHRDWFVRALDDPQRVLLMAERSGLPIGVLRFDVDGPTATVSIYLDPALHGRGLGTAVLLAGEGWLRRHRPDLQHLRAEVLAGNARSAGAFSRAGFGQTLVRFEKSLQDPMVTQ